MTGRPARRALVLVLAAFLGCASPGAPAAAPLDPAIAALPDPPAQGSDEAKADLAIVLWMQRTRTADDVERARKGAALDFALFAPALGPGFDPGAHPRTRALLQDARKRARPAVHEAKDRFRRARPYAVDARVVLAVEREPSFAYPSGHGTYGMVLARVLAELAPDRREALLRIGATVGNDRVIGGVHWPSDVVAGQQLGAALADRMLADPGFRTQLDEVKRAEWK